MLGILQLADEFYEVAHVPGLDRNVLRHRCSARPRVPECYMACATLTVNVNSEGMCDDFQVLYTPVAGIPPHSRKEFLGVGHDSMVPNTAPVNNTGWLTSPTRWPRS